MRSRCDHDAVTTPFPFRRLTTPRAAAAAGVLFSLLFTTALVLLWTTVPDGAAHGAQWTVAGSGHLKVAATLMPFAGIAFLWFIGVVRDGFAGVEDKFFSSVFLGAGLLFLAMVFATTSVGIGLAHSGTDVLDEPARAEVVAFATMTLTALGKTYALRMAAVFMISLATIWLKTGVMPRWLALATYTMALIVLVAADTSVWLTLVFPMWVLVVSLMLLARSGVIHLPGRTGDGSEST
ncbi:hypothetical protein H7J75_14230 [Mycolicibacterium canariasense]|nr:hypothetical protein [Mycolicibacterium canariasense]ORU99711.1 hypothetical protein AWB94_02420 [Mycolicibacterium canariasense]